MAAFSTLFRYGRSVVSLFFRNRSFSSDWGEFDRLHLVVSIWIFLREPGSDGAELRYSKKRCPHYSLTGSFQKSQAMMNGERMKTVALPGILKIAIKNPITARMG